LSSVAFGNLSGVNLSCISKIESTVCLLQLQTNEEPLRELDNLKRENQLLLEEQQLHKSQVCISLLTAAAAATCRFCFAVLLLMLE